MGNHSVKLFLFVWFSFIKFHSDWNWLDDYRRLVQLITKSPLI